ncbi:MAG TPA: MoaD/ThiS family protein [Cyclobacteriaceae bacterium]
MDIKIIAFGIAKDILNARDIKVNLEGDKTIKTLKTELIKKYPEFGKLASLKFAVNEDYQADSFVLNETDEVVIIPPVSGG